ncbi:Spy/CpxP family protein refolding chaperone [Psychrobacter sp. DM4]|uniref:Spy/CpxP family protein refolding chaperone n=1 Tax=Psychrobacter sp. DM4 TaxID=3440637 RepID=UPI003F4FF7BC
MKKLLLSTVLAASSVFAITACTSVGANTDTPATTQMQKQHKNGMKDGGRGSMSQLNLSATQQAQLQALKQNNRSNRMQNREAMLNILTADQRAQLATMQSEKQGKGHRRGDQKDGKNSPFAQLNLTAAQQAQIKAIRQTSTGDRMQQHNAIMQVLTIQQREQLETLKADRMAKGGHTRNMQH